MAISFEQSYLGLLRKHLGNQKVIAPACHAMIPNGNGDILFAKRADSYHWVLPAGSLELDESIYDCMAREVQEETGLNVETATLISIYSAPRYAFTNYYGGEHQMLAFVFRVDQWSGQLLAETDETVDARFFPLDALPEKLHPFYHEMLTDLQTFDGQVMLK